jgi:hypothetical protein
MKSFLAAILFAVALAVPTAAHADSQPTIITPSCGIAATGSATLPLIAVGTMSVTVTPTALVGASPSITNIYCGGAVSLSNSGSAMAATIQSAASFGAGFVWIANGDATATATMSGGFSGTLLAGQNILLTSNGTAWSQAGGSFFASVSQARTNLGLGTAATVNTGTSGATLCLLNGSACTFGALPVLPLPSTDIIVGNGSGAGAAVAVSGDLTLANTGATTLATVNGNAGSFGGVNSIPNLTVNAKGLVTAAGANVPAIPTTELTGQVTLAQLPNLPAWLTYCNDTSSSAAPANCIRDGVHSLDPAFGVTGNGTTDDTTALGLWLTACQAVGVCIADPTPGACYKVSAALSITTNATQLTGNNTSNTAGGPRFCTTSTTADLFDVNAYGVRISNIMIFPLTITQTAGVGINVGTGGTTYLNVAIDHVWCGSTQWTCIFMNNAQQWTISRSNISGQQYGVEVFLSGDSTIYANTISSVTAGIFFTASNGGLRVIGNKFAEAGGTVAISTTLNGAGISAADLIVEGNSLEGYLTGLTFQKGAGVGFSNVQIIGNQIYGTTADITMDTNSGWLTQLQINNNLLAVTGTGVTITAAASNFDMKDNNFACASSCSTATAFTIASGAANGDVENNHIFGITTAGYFTNASATTLIVDKAGLAFANLPSAAQNGSSIYISSGVTNGLTIGTCASGASNALATRINGAWDCF